MATPKMPGAEEPLPPDVEKLLVQFHKLDRAMRQRLLRAMTRPPVPEEDLGVIPYDELRSAKGILNLGGDAVEDCNAIYDDV